MKFQDYNKFREITESTSLKDWMVPLNEANSNTRYSVEVNFRTNTDEVLEAFAKIALGYVSASMKQSGFHIKQVYDEKPLRILVSTRNWDDGEWIVIVSFNPQHEGGSFVLSKGFYNREHRSVSIQSSQKTGDSAAVISADVKNILFALKNEPDRRMERLNPVKLKRGPKG